MFLRQSTSQLIELGPFLDQGDGVTEEVSLTILNTDIRLSKDGATWVDKNSGGATHREDGWYDLTLDTTDTATVGELKIKVQDPTVHLPVWVTYWVLEEAVFDALYDAGATGPLQGTTAGNTLDVNATGEAGLDLDNTSGTLDAAQIGTAAITAAKFASGAIDDAAMATGAFDNTVFAAGAIDSAAMATAAFDNTVFAAGAIDAAAIAADASDKILGALTGTATSGTTTTIIDTVNLTQGDTDYWVGSVVVMTSGNIAGQARRITAFDPGTDEITVDTAFTQAVAAQDYVIVKTAYAEAPAAGSGDWTSGEKENIRDALGVDGTKTAATGGQLQGTLTANPAAAGIASGSFAAGAIDAAAIATDAIDDDAIATGAIASTAFAAGAINAAAIANGAIDAATFAAGAINAAALATDAVDEIADGVWDEPKAGHVGVTTFGDLATDLDTALTDIAGVQSDTDDIQTRLPAALVGARMDCDVAVVQAGAIDAAAIATDAIDADAIAADAVTELRSVKSGTATGGSTTTLVSSDLTEGDNFYWKGTWLLITSGSTIGQVRLITDFAESTDTLTFTPNLTQAITTNTFEILPAGGVILEMWRGAFPAALIGTRVDSDVGAMQANVLDAAAIASDAVTELRSIKSGTASGGSTTTLISADLDEGDTNYWLGAWLLITSGTAIGQVRLITDFSEGADTLTFSPALTQAITTNTFEILPSNAVGLEMWRQSIPSSLNASRVEVRVGAMATDVVNNASLATTAVEEIARAINPEVNVALSNITFEMYDDTNHNPATGLTVTGERSLNAGSYQGVTGSINEISDGTYQFDAVAADMNGALIVFRFSSTGADDTYVHIKTAS